MAVIWAAVNGLDPVERNILMALTFAIADVIWAAVLTPSVG
jgi:hypothetical protein